MHSTSNLDDAYFGSGKVLKRSLNKHGIDNHEKEILEWKEDINSLKKREAELVNESLVNDSNCMNLQLGGGGGFINAEHAVKCQIAGTIARKEKVWNDSSYRERHSLRNTERFKNGKFIPLDWSNRKHRDQTKKKMSDAKKLSMSQVGERNSQFGTKWINNSIENKKIKSAELSNYLTNDWKLGRIKNSTRGETTVDAP